jgi:hypothetical protein
MTGLSPETLALLEQGRSGDDPSVAVIERNRRELTLKVAGAALGTAAVTGSATKALAATATAKVLAICGAVVVAGAAVGGYALRSPAPAPSAPALARARAPEPVVERELLPPPLVEAPRLAPPAEPARRAASAAKGATPPSIQSELELIRGAQRHLHRGEARAALALLNEHAQRFPSGVLAQERDASRVLALCQAGDPGARAQAERFLQRSPQSPFAERVRASCATGKR